MAIPEDGSADVVQMPVTRAGVSDAKNATAATSDGGVLRWNEIAVAYDIRVPNRGLKS